MNLDGINRWLSLGANVGVVVGLALLVFELRQNSELDFQSRFADYDNLFYQYQLGYLDVSYYQSRVVS